LLAEIVLLLQFNRGKIPERVVHARGMTAKGYFEVGITYSRLMLKYLNENTHLCYLHQP